MGELPDQQIVALFVGFGIRETLANEIRFPLVDAALSSSVSLGLSSEELRCLTSLRQQAHLLNDTARLMKDWHDRSFTILDDTNHPRVVQNHQHQRGAFLKRSTVVLDFVRQAADTFASRV
jgi:hypothetical protein